MTKEQQQQVLDNEWVVNAVCKKLGITDYDIKGDLMLFMCKTIDKYDQSKGVKIGTYLYRSVYLWAFRLLKKDRKYRYRNIFIAEILPTGKQKQTHSGIIKKTIITPQENKVIPYILQGYNTKEISKMIGIHSYEVKDIFENYVERVRTQYEDETKIGL